MNYNNIIQKKKQTYTNIEDANNIYIFEVIINYNNGHSSTIRKIKKLIQGTIISCNDNIIYNNINQIKISVININNIDNIIIADININHSLNYTTFLSNQLYLEFTNKNNLIVCEYNIIKI